MEAEFAEAIREAQMAEAERMMGLEEDYGEEEAILRESEWLGVVGWMWRVGM